MKSKVYEIITPKILDNFWDKIQEVARDINQNHKELVRKLFYGMWERIYKVVANKGT